MVANLARFVGAMAMFAAAVFLFSNAPDTWRELDNLTADRQIILKTLYSLVTAFLLGGSVGLLLQVVNRVR